MGQNFDNTERRDTASSGGKSGKLGIGITVVSIVGGIILGIMSRNEAEPPEQGINPIPGPPSTDMFHVHKATETSPALTGRIKSGDLSIQLVTTADGKSSLRTSFSEDFFRRVTLEVANNPVPATGAPDELGDRLDLYADFARQKRMREDERRLNELRDRWTARKKPS